MLGYGRLAEVNLSDGKVEYREIDERLAFDFIGGRGWCAYTIFKELDKIVAPLHPSNVLVVATGPLNGVIFQSGGKTSFAAISPATGIYGDSSVGGFLGNRMRRAGIDGIIIRGAAPEPVYLLVADNRVEIHPANNLWGMHSREADKLLTERYGSCSVATIGVAGERMVYYAAINVDWDRGKLRHAQAGRTGMGAVMGSKKVKAIVAAGTGEVKVADRERLAEVARKFQKAVKQSDNYSTWLKYGTTSTIEWANEVGALPTRNFQSTVFEYADKIGGEVVSKEKVASTPCSNCITPCGHVIEFEKKDRVVADYENLAMLGSNLGLGDFEKVMWANYLCDYYGLDTISTGAVLGFVMECYEKGLITQEEIGVDARWGNAEAIYRMIEMIAKREGFGDLMAQGVKALAERIGKGSEKFAMHVKGLEISAYDHRAAPAMALSYATCDIGGHHNRSWAITYDVQVGRESYGEEKVDRVIYLQHLRPLYDMLGVCRFYFAELSVDPSLHAEAYSAVVGREFSIDDLLLRSEKVWNITRAIAILRKGVDSRYDMPPLREFEDPVPEGPVKGWRLDREKFMEMLRLYYRKRGWDERGWPTREKLLELGLPEVAEKLYPDGG